MNQNSAIKVLVQNNDFDLEQEYNWLRSQRTGAVCLFSGLVREMVDGAQSQSLELEHYPGMTETQLMAIVEQANTRWQLQAVVVIHRYGVLQPGDQIVLVGVGAVHRADAFAACEYVMDYLKTDAPFWKKEKYGDSERWVQSQNHDISRKQRWTKS